MFDGKFWLKGVFCLVLFLFLFNFVGAADSSVVLKDPKDLSKSVSYDFGYSGSKDRLKAYNPDYTMSGVVWKLTDNVRTSPISGEAFISLSQPVQVKDLKKFDKYLTDKKGSNATIQVKVFALVDNTRFVSHPVYVSVPRTFLNATPYSDLVIESFESKLVEENVWRELSEIDEKTSVQNLMVFSDNLKPNQDYDWHLGELPWAWWNSTWTYKKAISLSVTSGTTWQGYQVLLNVTSNAHMNSDFCDLRFLNGSENSLLPYWIEPEGTSNGNYARIYVKVDQNISTTAQNIYMYYGNTSAVSCGSSGKGTFDLFDDFEDASINATLWQSGGTTVSETNGYLYLADTASSAPYLQSFSQFGYGYEFRTYASATGGTGNLDFFGFSSQAAGSCYNGGGGWSYYTAWPEKLFVGGNPYNQNATAEQGINFTFIISNDNSSASRWQKLRSATLANPYSVITNYYFTSAAIGASQNVSVCSPANAGNDALYFYWMLVRKAHVVEPVGVFGAEGIDALAPNVTLVNPVSGTYNSSVTMVFAFTPFDFVGFRNCSVWGNWSGAWAVNNSNTSAITNNSVNFISVAGIPEGAWRWNVECWNGASLSNLSSSNNTFLMDRSAPAWTYVTNSPNLTAFSLLSGSGNVNYSERWVSGDASAVNPYSVSAWFGVNNSYSAVYGYFINGTNQPYTFWQNTTLSLTNVSSTWNFSIANEQLYPARYTFNQSYMESASKSSLTLSNTNSFLNITLFNVTTTAKYNFFEVYAVNNSAVSNPLNAYYCNSSYSTGAVLSSSFCTQIGAISAGTVYNHSHSANSKHYLLPFTINTTTGKIGSVVVTSKSQFMLRGATNGWTVYYITNNSNTMSTTSNNGVSWTNQAGSPDAHIHQYDDFTNLSVKIYACDYLGNCGNSSIILNNINLTNVPPQPPVFTAPVASYYKGSNVLVVFSAASSPVGASISRYNVSLVYPNTTFVATINASATNLVASYDSTLFADGNYSVWIRTTDSNNLYSDVFSEEYLIDNTVPNVTINAPRNNSYFALKYGGLTINGTAVDYGVGLANIWVNSSVWSGLQTSSPFNFSNSSAVTDGYYYLTVLANDSLNNTNYSQVYFTIDSSVPFAVSVGTPTNWTNSSNSYVLINATFNDSFSVSNCSLQWSNGTNTTMTLVSLSSTSAYCTYNQSVTSTGQYDFSVWGCDSANNCNASMTRWVYVNSSGFSVSALYPLDGQSSASPLLFGYRPVQQLVAFANCSLYANGVLLNTTVSPANDTIIEYEGSLAIGAYNWSVTCFDSVGNNVYSGSRGLTVQSVNPAESPVRGGGGGGGFVSDVVSNVTAPITAFLSQPNKDFVSSLIAGYTVVSKSNLVLSEDVVLPVWLLLLFVYGFLAFVSMKTVRGGFDSDYEFTALSAVFVVFGLVTFVLGVSV